MADWEWSHEEIKASVEAYLEMLSSELAGLPHNKAATNRKLREGPLFRRTKGAVEMRMCNISSVLNDQNLPFIDGYKPRSNVGPTVTAMVLKALKSLDYNPQAIVQGPNKVEESLLDDLEAAQKKGEFRHVSETEKQSIMKSRIGQGRFRQLLIDLWGGCAVTGLTDTEILVASHIKPWRSSTNLERLDPYNGLLLLPHLDSLFDKGLITFEESGGMLVSEELSERARIECNIYADLKLRIMNPLSLTFLKFHREEVFRK